MGESWRDFHSLNSLYDTEKVGRIWVKSTYHLCFALIFHFQCWKELKDWDISFFSEWSLNFSCPPWYNLKILVFSLGLGKYFLVVEMNQSLPIHSVRIANNLLYDLRWQNKLAFWSVSKCKKCIASSLKVQILILLLSCCWATCLTLVLSLSRRPVAWLQVELVNLQDVTGLIHFLHLRMAMPLQRKCPQIREVL